MRGVGLMIHNYTSCDCYCSILKFGVEIGNDVKRIHKMYNCKVNGCIDLRNLAVRSGVNV